VTAAGGGDAGDAIAVDRTTGAVAIGRGVGGAAVGVGKAWAVGASVGDSATDPRGTVADG
jgi:hypothetical protein